MQSKRRNGRTSTRTSVEDEIAHLRGLDLKGLRSRWQTVFQRSAPAHLTRYLLFAVIAYRIQVDRYGDLDHATRQLLEPTDSREARPAMSARPGSYKPAARNFDYMIEKLGEIGVRREKILHTAESMFHDHKPANDHGLKSCWIYRRHDKEGFGATMNPGQMPHFDFRFTSMHELVKTHQEQLRVE